MQHLSVGPCCIHIVYRALEIKEGFKYEEQKANTVWEVERLRTWKMPLTFCKADRQFTPPHTNVCNLRLDQSWLNFSQLREWIKLVQPPASKPWIYSMLLISLPFSFLVCIKTALLPLKNLEYLLWKSKLCIEKDCPIQEREGNC